MKNFTRIMSLILALIIVLSMVACGTKNPDPTEGTKLVETHAEETTAAEDPVVETEPREEVENLVTLFSMTLGDSYDDVRFMSAFANEDGTTHVEYVGEEKKVGDIATNALGSITAELAKTELLSLSGSDNHTEGDANAHMYIEFADNTALSVNFSGEIPKAYSNGFAIMEKCFQDLTASMPVYVSHPRIVGEVDETIASEMLDILNGSGIENLDGITIMGLNANDELFASSAGLSVANGVVAVADGVVTDASGAPMMISQAYSLVIVKLEDANTAENIAKDLENNIDWEKWVGVATSHALIATKDDMILCLHSANDMYSKTTTGIQNAGWMRMNEIKNPDM